MIRNLKYFQAINEAIDQCMEKDPSVYIMGMGVPDPKGVFGSTLGLLQKYGNQRVMDMPTSENGMTGVAIGSALAGMRPILTHQRTDFALLSMEQIVNQAANWSYMFGGQKSVPLVIRMIIGRGWGQGPQHSQSLQSWFAHIPGLKVVMPTTPYDAKGLLISSIEDDNPVIFFEHRWLYNISGLVPEEYYCVPIGMPELVKEGEDLTIISTSYMTLEALRAAELLSKDNIKLEVIDVRTLRPLNDKLIVESVRKTGRVIVADTGWKTCGFGSEIVARIIEKVFDCLKTPPKIVALHDCPTPTSRALSDIYYPRSIHIVRLVKQMLGFNNDDTLEDTFESIQLDVPDESFKGPF